MARSLYEKSLALSQELGDRSGIARSLSQLGQLYQLQGDLGLARELYGQALAISEELSDKQAFASILHRLGTVSESEEDFSTALSYAAQAFYIFDQLRSPDREISGRALSRLKEKMGAQDFDVALKNLSEEG